MNAKKLCIQHITPLSFGEGLGERLSPSYREGLGERLLGKALLLPMLFLPLSLSAQHLSTESAAIDCGQVLFGHPVTAVYEMRNSGNQPLTIKDVRTSCGCTTVDWPSTAIAAGKNFQITVRYDAQTMGHFDKQIGIESNAADTMMVLSLHGVVVPSLATFVGKYDYKIDDLRLDHNDVEFDDVNRGDKPVQQIHIINKGEQTLQPVVMHLPSYLKASVSPTQLAPGHSGVVTLMLDSRAIRDFGLTQSSIYLGMFPGDKVAPEKEISVSAVILPDFDHLTDAQRANAPKMILSAEKIDLGHFDGKDKKKGVLEITNTGKSTLKVRSLQMFTTGLEVSLNKTQIEPGKTAKLKVTAYAKQLRKARSKPRILMITNDPNQTKVILNVNVE